MGLRFRHRHAIALTFVVLGAVTLVGGLLNSTDARGRVVDDLTDKGVKDAKITHGTLVATTDADGAFAIPDVPKTSVMQIDAQGYLRTRAPTTATEIRLSPLSVTIYAYDATKTESDRVPDPEARAADDHTKLLAAGNESGQIIVTPHPGKDAKAFICAKGFEPKEITVEGVLMQIGLQPGGTGCPPIPTPTPSSTPTPTSTASPIASPTPTPSASPTP